MGLYTSPPACTPLTSWESQAGTPTTWSWQLKRLAKDSIASLGTRPASRARTLNYRADCARRAPMSRYVMLSLAAAGVLLSGCSHNFRLLEDGKVHQGVLNQAAKTIEATIDGVKFSGPASQGVGVGFGQTFYGGKVGFGTTTMVTGQWQGLMTDASGKVIRCQFQFMAGSGQGMCQDNSGRTYDMVFGGLATPDASGASTVCSAGVIANGRCGG